MVLGVRELEDTALLIIFGVMSTGATETDGNIRHRQEEDKKRRTIRKQRRMLVLPPKRREDGLRDRL